MINKRNVRIKVCKRRKTVCAYGADAWGLKFLGFRNSSKSKIWDCVLYCPVNVPMWAFFDFLSRVEVIKIKKIGKGRFRVILAFNCNQKEVFWLSFFSKLIFQKKPTLFNYKFCSGVWAIIRIIFEYQLLIILKVCNRRSTPIMHLWGG